MKVLSVLLAEAATNRDGYVSVLGLGVNLFGMDRIPGPLDAALVVQVEFEPGEAEDEHQLVIGVRGRGEHQPIGRRRGTFLIEKHMDQDMAGYSAMIFDMRGLDIPTVGYYEAYVTIDGVETRPVQFKILSGSDTPTDDSEKPKTRARKAPARKTPARKTPARKTARRPSA